MPHTRQRANVARLGCVFYGNKVNGRAWALQLGFAGYCNRAGNPVSINFFCLQQRLLRRTPGRFRFDFLRRANRNTPAGAVYAVSAPRFRHKPKAADGRVWLVRLWLPYIIKLRAAVIERPVIPLLRKSFNFRNAIIGVSTVSVRLMRSVFIIARETLGWNDKTARQMDAANQFDIYD